MRLQQMQNRKEEGTTIQTPQIRQMMAANHKSITNVQLLSTNPIERKFIGLTLKDVDLQRLERLVKLDLLKLEVQQLTAALDKDLVMMKYDRKVLSIDSFLSINIIDKGRDHKGIYICHEEPSNKSPDIHWILVLIHNCTIFYVDVPDRERNVSLWRKLKETLLPIKTLPMFHRRSWNTLYGEYCLFFAFHLARNLTLETIDHIYLGKVPSENNQMVEGFIEKHFPMNKSNFRDAFSF